MPPSILLLLLLLLAFLHLPPALSFADFCDTEPRLSITTHHCPSNPSPRLLVHLPPLDQNPFHALHDHLWALSHYLHHCVSHHHPVLHIQSQPVPPDHCTAHTYITTAYWAVCATIALAQHLHADLIFGSLHDACFEKRLQIKSPTNPGLGDLTHNFRALTWFGRACVPDPSGQCLPNTETSTLVPLPDRYKAAALVAFRSALMSFVRVTFESHPRGTADPRVRVLLYDRNDTTRRQWMNVADVYKLLHKDHRVEVTFVRRMPRLLKEQVELYSWADVLVAPHGAAMVNTVFMRPGTEIVEIYKRCDMNIEYDRFVPHDWTGWHASLLDVNIQYVQCHRMEAPYKNPSQLLDGKLGPPTDGPHKVRIEELMTLLDSAIERQKLRIQVQGDDSQDGRSVTSDVRSMYTSLAVDGRFTLASRASLYLLISACSILLALWNLVKRRKGSGKR